MLVLIDGHRISNEPIRLDQTEPQVENQIEVLSVQVMNCILVMKSRANDSGSNNPAFLKSNCRMVATTSHNKERTSTSLIKQIIFLSFLSYP